MLQRFFAVIFSSQNNVSQNPCVVWKARSRSCQVSSSNHAALCVCYVSSLTSSALWRKRLLSYSPSLDLFILWRIFSCFSLFLSTCLLAKRKPMTPVGSPIILKKDKTCFLIGLLTNADVWSGQRITRTTFCELWFTKCRLWLFISTTEVYQA